MLGSSGPYDRPSCARNGEVGASNRTQRTPHRSNPFTDIKGGAVVRRHSFLGREEGRTVMLTFEKRTSSSVYRGRLSFQAIGGGASG